MFATVLKLMVSAPAPEPMASVSPVAVFAPALTVPVRPLMKLMVSSCVPLPVTFWLATPSVKTLPAASART